MKPLLVIAVLSASLFETAATSRSFSLQLPPRALCLLWRCSQRTPSSTEGLPSASSAAPAPTAAPAQPALTTPLPPSVAAAISHLRWTATVRALRGGGDNEAGGAGLPRQGSGDEDATAAVQNGEQLGSWTTRGNLEPAQGNAGTAVDVANVPSASNTGSKGLAGYEDTADKALGSSGGTTVNQESAATAVSLKPGAAVKGLHGQVDAKEEALRAALLAAEGPSK